MTSCASAARTTRACARAATATTALVRIAVLSALLMLAVYTVFASVKLASDPAGRRPVATRGGADRRARLAGRAEAEVARLDAALTAAGAIAQRLRPIRWTRPKPALKAGQPTAQAVALVGDDGVRAVAGDAGDADWAAAAQAARASGKASGSAGRARRRALYAARRRCRRAAGQAVC